MKNKWIKQGGNYKVVPSSISVEEELPTAIYSIHRDPLSGELSLNYVADKFEFDFDLLGLEHEFINHALVSYENTTGNFGVLLNGIKGTGKTVTAKILANTLKKPVILVDAAYPGIDSFLAGLNFECVLFFDEFEKNFDPKEDINILTIMDGVFNCNKRKVFILTTNDLRINTCLLSRPSRIRYKKEFTNISGEVINSLLDNFLEDQSIREDLFLYVTTLETCSVDIIKSLITEINIHGKDKFEYIKTIFNVNASPVYYNTVTAEGSYYDFTKQAHHVRSREEALNDLMLFAQLVSKANIRTDEEEKLYDDLRNKECDYDFTVRFPGRIYDLKPGMFLLGNPIIEVIEDLRVVITQSPDNKLHYTYACPAFAFNQYQGNVAF